MCEKYYCIECQKYHYRGKIYNEHKQHASKLSNSEIWKQQFRKSWKNYSINSHCRTNGSKKQIQKSVFLKMNKR
jgi:hypothetical protein